MTALFDRPLAAWSITVGAALAVLSPALSSSRKDGFPLSTYPMFGWKREKTLSVEHAVGIGPSGEIPIAPRFLGTAEVLEARVTLQNIVRGGSAVAVEACRAIAMRIARETREPHASVRVIEIRTLTVEAVAWVGGEAESPKPQVHARCRVRR